MHFVLFFIIFSVLLQCCSGGGWEQLIVIDGMWGDIKFPYNLDMLLILHHAMMMGDVNISCNLPTYVVDAIPHWGGGKLALHIICSRC